MKEIELLNHALTYTLGVRVSTNNPRILSVRLSRLIRKHPQFATLKVQASRDNPETEIWIVHAQASNPAAGAEEAGPAV